MVVANALENESQHHQQSDHSDRQDAEPLACGGERAGGKPLAAELGLVPRATQREHDLRVVFCVDHARSLPAKRVPVNQARKPWRGAGWRAGRARFGSVAPNMFFSRL